MSTAKKRPVFRVLIADDNSQVARRLAEHLISLGFEARTVSTGRDAKLIMNEWFPKFVIADLMLPDGNALDLCDHIKNDRDLKNRGINVIVMSGHNVQSNVKMALERGAKDFLVKPFRQEDLVKRLIFHSRSYHGIQELTPNPSSEAEEVSILNLTNLVLRQALGKERLSDVLTKLTRMVSLKLGGVRCSIVHCVDQKMGMVVTSNDDVNASGLQLDLYKYPEITHVMNTQSAIVIENVEETAEVRHIREAAKEISFNSMIVCPVSRRSLPFGVLSLRLSPERAAPTEFEVKFVEIVSHVASLVLSSEVHKTSDSFWMHSVRPVVPFTKKTS